MGRLDRSDTTALQKTGVKYNAVVTQRCVSPCERVPCAYTDEKCLTESCDRSFKKFIKGKSGAESSDPLHLDPITIDLPKMKYGTKNNFFSGMSNCHVALTRISIENSKFQYNIACPNLTMKTDYDMEGQLNSKDINETGNCVVNFDDYLLRFEGNYGQYNGVDNKIHLQVKTYKFTPDNKARVHYECKKHSSDDKQKSNDWRDAHQQAAKYLLISFMEKYMTNVNRFLERTSNEDLFYQE
ncbi:unnamed protein product [Spodoptera exigua]|nr:unnamed protein product [Spodoptera exigua]